MWTASNIYRTLQDLSNASDKIIEETKRFDPLISGWVALVKQHARNIVESENGSDSSDIPTLKSFLSGSSRRTAPRISTVFGEIQKSHLHQKGRASFKISKLRRSSIKTPLKRKSYVKKLDVNTILPSSEEAPAAAESSTPPAKRSLKRKSSSKLSSKTIKKAKLKDEADKLNNAREGSVQIIHQSEKLMKAKNSSLLPNYANIKSSVGADLILSENRTLRSKMEAKQEKAIENLKNIMALKKLKLAENKRNREEKLQKTLQQRLMLEKEKLSKLKSVGKEKTIKEATPKAMQNKINAENESLGGETSHSLKNKKEKETTTKTLKGNLKKAGGPSTLRSNEKTPVNKNAKKTETEKIMNTTYGVPQGKEESSNVKGKTLEKVNIGNSGNTKDASSVKRTQTPLTKKIEQKKVTESYEMTPARSSLQSYDISEIRSDSEDEDSKEDNKKQIPSWATGVRLRNALLQQHHHPIDSDELFGNTFDNIDLEAIMGVKKRRYTKRTSSAIWNNSILR